MHKAYQIFLNTIPVLAMIGLIPVVQNDYTLTLLYIVIIFIALLVRREKNDVTVMAFGFCIMIVSEYIFISTGVETFVRNTLFGLMPLWLPFLWAYGFVTIRRGVEILNK